MNILQICANYPPVPGGSGMYTQNLSLELLKSDINVTVLTFKPNKKDLRSSDGILNIKRVEAFDIDSIEYPIFYPSLLFHIHKIVKDNNIDVINSHTRFFTSTHFAALYKKLNNKITFVHTEHGAGPLVHKNRIISSLCNMSDNTLGKFAVQAADIPIAIGPSSKNFLISLGCKKEINIVSNSINCSEFEKLPVEKRDRNQRVKITYIGRLVESKGVHKLIKVFSDIEKKYDAELCIVGSGPEEDNLRRLVKSLHVNNIEFLGFRNDIRNILSTTDIFVNPSSYDSVPTTILEAGCLGIRTISTNVGDIRHIVGNDYSYLYDANSTDMLKEKLEEAIRKSDFKDNKLKERIYEYFDWKVNTKKYIDIINKNVKN